MRSCRSLPTGSSANAVTTAVSKPKQRFSPRATLYSPPPLQASSARGVARRRSAGLSRTMTSPRLTRSQRQSLFSLIVNAMRPPQPPVQNKNCYPLHSHGLLRMIPDSALSNSNDPRRLHPGSQNMDHGKSHQIGGASNQKWNHVASRPLQDMAYDFGNKHAADCARHSGYAHDRRTQLRQVHPVLAFEKIGDPKKIEPPDRVGQEFSASNCPRLPERQEAQPLDLFGRLRSVAQDVFELSPGTTRVVFWFLIQQEP